MDSVSEMIIQIGNMAQSTDSATRKRNIYLPVVEDINTDDFEHREKAGIKPAFQIRREADP